MKRYTPDCSGNMVESDTGFYVEYRDYVILQEKLNNLEKKVFDFATKNMVSSILRGNK